MLKLTLVEVDEKGKEYFDYDRNDPFISQLKNQHSKIPFINLPNWSYGDLTEEEIQIDGKIIELDGEYYFELL